MVHVKVRDLATIAEKWVTETPKRAPYYEAGVKAPKEDWATKASAAAPVYKAAVTAPNIDKLYSGGVKKAGTAKWQKKAIELGVARFGPGVSAAKDDYASGFGPYRDEIEKVDLPERGPRGADTNWERSKKLGKALNLKRLALKAAGS
jgi:hypothetical protein